MNIKIKPNNDVFGVKIVIRYISDKTRHSQSEIHLQNRQNRQRENMQNFGNGVEIIIN